ncbi:hypothetical protein [Microbacterium flavum]|uniref:Uncharacterized protein n=1 Tax=Microbacterium flavum TaxID=415216 RepID=A0ABS5XY53_9MICO|nr:hypothetical protein [Microbacterium flavum]MBT8799366.1 hypothetical protein [Microbacterium flavum]
MTWADLGLPDAPEPSGNETPAPKPPREPKPPKPPREPKPPRDPKPPKPPKPPREPRPASGGRPPRDPDDTGSRLPVVLGVVAGVLLIAVVVTLGIALTRPSSDAGPVGPPDPGPTTAPTTQPTASPTSSPTGIGAPVAVQFGGTGFTLVDKDDQTVFTHQWRDKADVAVAALTQAFGAAPTQRVEAGDGSSYPDYTVYQWDGFLLYDMVDGTGGAQRATFTQPSYATFSRNTVGKIEMTAERGLKIGSTIAAVRAATPDREIPRGNVGSIRFVFDIGRSTAGPPVQYSMVTDTDGTSVTAVLYYFAAGS